jgi:hypothetical protein
VHPWSSHCVDYMITLFRRSYQLHRGNVQHVYGTSSVFTYVGFPTDGSGMYNIESSTFFAAVPIAGGSTGCAIGDLSAKVRTNKSNILFYYCKE